MADTGSFERSATYSPPPPEENEILSCLTPYESDMESEVSVLSEISTDTAGYTTPSTTPSPSARKLLKGGRPRASSVWDYFDYFDEKRKKSICKVKVGDKESGSCGFELAGKFTTNMKQHLKTSHNTCYKNEHQKCQKKKKDASIPYVIKAKKQSTILSTFKDAKPFGKLSPEYKKLFRKLTVFIASANTLYSIVENEEFCSLMEAAEPRFQLPGRAVVMKEVICLVEEVKSVIQGYLHHACKIHLCTDIWSKKGLSSSYLGITAHFFSSKDNACHHILLSMKRMPHPHSGENIRNLVMKCLEEWDISPQAINVVVTDNGSNVVKAFRDDCHHASNTTNVNESQQDIEESDDDLSSEDGEFRDENNEEEIVDLSNREDDFDICEEDHTIAFQSYFKRIPASHIHYN